MSQDEEGQPAEGEIMGPRNKKKRIGRKVGERVVGRSERDRGERSWRAQLKKIAKVRSPGEGV